jgi:hypothetical protein
LTQDVGALPGGANGKVYGAWAFAYEVSGKQDGIWLEKVDLVDDSAQKRGLGVLVHVDVAELRNTGPFEGNRQVGQMDIGLNNIDPVALDLAGVEREAGSAEKASFEQTAASEALAGRWIFRFHIPW